MLNEALEEIEGNFKEKSESIVKFIKNLEADVTAITEEEKRLSKRKKSTENTIKSLKTYLILQMKRAEIYSLKTPLFSVSVRNNKSIEVQNFEKIPQEYLVAKQAEVSKTLIKEALKNGIEVPGIELVDKDSIYIK